MNDCPGWAFHLARILMLPHPKALPAGVTEQDYRACVAYRAAKGLGRD